MVLASIPEVCHVASSLTEWWMETHKRGATVQGDGDKSGISRLAAMYAEWEISRLVYRIEIKKRCSATVTKGDAGSVGGCGLPL